jgi:diguanylate cyclase
VRFTASIGVSSYAKGESIEQVIERADQALYQAKRAGRNRVVGLPSETERAA